MNGTYVRTAEVRAKNSANARPGEPCADDCTCRKHRPQTGPIGKRCEPGCDCGKHHRTPEHNARISMSVALTLEAIRGR